jgi:UDP-N-acetylmuramate dehydrogenase
VHEHTGVPLAGLTTLRVGGPAARLVVAETDDEVVETVRAADARGEPLLVLGGGSNLVVADAGFDGTVLQVATRGVEVAAHAEHALEIAAGVDWDHAVSLAVDEGYAGIEALSGIPGRVGAAPIQNVGAYGQEVAQTVARVRVLDRTTHDVVDLGPGDCGFGYRDSAFKRIPDRYVVLGVAFALEHSRLGAPVQYAELARRLGVEPGERAPAADVRRAVLDLRRGKGMVLDPDDHDTWSAGSFFTNPLLDPADAARLPDEAPRWPERDGRVKTSAAWLIEQAGFGKGHGTGAARVSSKHTLALTNRGGATAGDLLALAREIRDGVRGRFGVELTVEPVLVGASL